MDLNFGSRIRSAIPPSRFEGFVDSQSDLTTMEAREFPSTETPSLQNLIAALLSGSGSAPAPSSIDSSPIPSSSQANPVFVDSAPIPPPENAVQIYPPLLAILSARGLLLDPITDSALAAETPTAEPVDAEGVSTAETPPTATASPEESSSTAAPEAPPDTDNTATEASPPTTEP